MQPIPNATISSIYSSALGCVVILLWISVTELIDANETIEALSSMGGALFIYSISVILVFALAFLVGSPIYYVLYRLGIANYISSSVLGAAFVLVIFGVGIEQIYWLLAGIATGCSYHHAYTKHRKT
jgi:hypothetical protein